MITHCKGVQKLNAVDHTRQEECLRRKWIFECMQATQQVLSLIEDFVTTLTEKAI